MMGTRGESMSAPHPAPFSVSILDRSRSILDDLLPVGASILDPFAGTGRIHQLSPCWRTVGVEIETEWASLHPGTLIGDATALPFPDATFDAAFSSPAYGNRLADHHEAKDGSYRRTYRHLLGRPLHAHNAGAMQWGGSYRALHEQAWAELRRVLRPGGWFLLNIKDHYRQGQRVTVCDWHLATLSRLGFDLLEAVEVPSPGFRYGANRTARYPEMLYTLEASR